MAKLRGHHLICLHFYDGEGYDEPFIENLERVLAEAKKEGARVAEGPDEICALCRYRRGERCTLSDTADREIRGMDAQALALLGLSPGGQVEWESLRETVTTLFPQWYATHCFGCSWKPVCEKNALYRSLQKRQP